MAEQGDIAERLARIGSVNGSRVTIATGGSSVINAISWDADTLNLTVVVSGKTYNYPGIGLATVEAFAAAPSKGSFYASEIKGNGRPTGASSIRSFSSGLRRLR